MNHLRVLIAVRTENRSEADVLGVLGDAYAIAYSFEPRLQLVRSNQDAFSVDRMRSIGIASGAMQTRDIMLSQVFASELRVGDLVELGNEYAAQLLSISGVDYVVVVMESIWTQVNTLEEEIAPDRIVHEIDASGSSSYVPWSDVQHKVPGAGAVTAVDWCGWEWPSGPAS